MEILWQQKFPDWFSIEITWYGNLLSPKTVCRKTNNKIAFRLFYFFCNWVCSCKHDCTHMHTTNVQTIRESIALVPNFRNLVCFFTGNRRFCILALSVGKRVLTIKYWPEIQPWILQLETSTIVLHLDRTKLYLSNEMTIMLSNKTTRGINER